MAGMSQALAIRNADIAARSLQAAVRRRWEEQAAAQAKALIVDPEMLEKLARLLGSVEEKCARSLQRRWRTRCASQDFRDRHAAKKIEKSVLSRNAVRKQAEEEARRRATVRLQCALRRRLARRRAQQAVRDKALGLLREQWGANREMRALGESFHHPKSHACPERLL